MPEQTELIPLSSVPTCPSGPDWARPGVEVGAGRWPDIGGGEVGRPWRGWILATDDPRAWAGSIRFGDRTPSQAECASHVQWCRKQGLLMDEAPVLWEFGRVLWQKFGADQYGLKPYELDVVLQVKANSEKASRRVA